MSDPTSQYPTRPRFFANKFLRRMAKTCLANQIGTDACWLLTCVVMTEDAKAYTGAVTFYNEQLLPLAGLHSPDTLDRVRRKAVDAGWLHYERGGKTLAGKYWVVVPAEFEGMDDGATDEGPTPPPATYVRKTAAPNQDKPDSMSAPVRSQPRFMCGTNRDSCADLSTLPFPLPQNTSAAAPRPPIGSVKPNPEPKSPPKPARSSDAPPGHSEAVAGFCDAWQAKYREKYPFAGGRDGAAVKAMLAHCSGSVPKFLAAAGRYLADPDPFYAGHTLSKFNQNFARWLAKPPAAPARRGYDEPD